MHAFEDTPQNGIVERLLGRHSLPLSVVLHLVPGALIVVVYLLIGEPVVEDIGYPAFAGWAIALCLVLIPVLWGLLWLGRKHNGCFSLRGVLQYTDKPVPRGKLVAMVIALIVWMMVLGFALAPVNNFSFENFFTWLPYADTGGSGNNTYLDLDEYPHSIVLTTMVVCLPLTGISLPLIEELYFRGFLLPRIDHLGGWAPVVSTVLFALYHFWSPWVFVSRVIFTFPGYWFAWRNKDIRLSIGMHVGVTSIVATIGTIAVALELI
ncbi:CPBP family intramembrane metalloprotease [Nocardia abscessus]|uniref:CPBP family intramembrane glutamic endopeptidase n=1 Tax=Nocardia abscessus TaxID=120957 RepID=UPI001895420A|nr:CPBP family intramembrane glutamic endopeptidase [Nocardia abscessus]MBF6341679.1 CPBP family intramembrane metalloprotease [Nocardia abscessus]